MNIQYPDCNETDFQKDLYDNQIYECTNCGVEVRVLTENEGILTKDEKGALTSL